jgi:hypothetical protein
MRITDSNGCDGGNANTVSTTFPVNRYKEFTATRSNGFACQQRNVLPLREAAGGPEEHDKGKSN